LVHLPVRGDDFFAHEIFGQNLQNERKGRENLRRSIFQISLILSDHLSLRFATPGRVLPSSSSSEAPPPVEAWVTLSITPNFFAAVAVSPPPTTVIAPEAVAAAIASAIDFVPSANFANSNTPAGPFQMIVRARPMTS